MFDIAWSEMVLIGAVALVVIGPKDLPKVLRTVGQTVGKVRRMAAEFQGQVNEAIREAELADLKKQVEDVGGTVSSALNSDYKPIEEPKDFGASATGEAKPDEAALKEAEAKLAALPAPEPLPPVDIAAETPNPAADPVPAAKPKRVRKAKAPESVAEAAPVGEVDEPGAKANDDTGAKPRAARSRRVKVTEAAAPEEADTPFPEVTAVEAAPKPARTRKSKAAAKGEESSA